MEEQMSPTFMVVMGTLNALTSVALFTEGKTALSICFATYAISSIAMIWVTK
jgi:hypothetical protein